jgi:hypothetical protein
MAGGEGEQRGQEERRAAAAPDQPSIAESIHAASSRRAA